MRASTADEHTISVDRQADDRGRGRCTCGWSEVHFSPRRAAEAARSHLRDVPLPAPKREVTPRRRGF